MVHHVWSGAKSIIDLVLCICCANVVVNPRHTSNARKTRRRRIGCGRVFVPIFFFSCSQRLLCDANRRHYHMHEDGNMIPISCIWLDQKHRQDGEYVIILLYCIYIHSIDQYSSQKVAVHLLNTQYLC